MAKVAFSKLKCKINETEKEVRFNEEVILIKQYLPIQDKLNLIQRVIERSHEENYNFNNPVKTQVFTELEMLLSYTNLSFTEKQKEDLPKLYDLLASENIIKLILDNIPNEEKNVIFNGIQNTIAALYAYQNSIVGVLDTLNNSQEIANFDLNKIQEVLNNLEDSPSIQHIASLMGPE